MTFVYVLSVLKSSMRDFFFVLLVVAVCNKNRGSGCIQLPKSLPVFKLSFKCILLIDRRLNSLLSCHVLISHIRRVVCCLCYDCFTDVPLFFFFINCV